MIIISISDQCSYYYIRLDDIRNIGFVWQKLSEKGYFKFHGYFNIADMSEEWYIGVQKLYSYYDSLDKFLAK